MTQSIEQVIPHQKQKITATNEMAEMNISKRETTVPDPIKEKL